METNDQLAACGDRYVFEQSLLPPGFRYPASFLNAINNGLPSDLRPWWFIGKLKNVSLFWLSTLADQYPERVLIPFAKRDDLSDTLAAFDGLSHAIDPIVYHVHAYTEPGWEIRGQWPSFDEWLKQAIVGAAQFKITADE